MKGTCREGAYAITGAITRWDTSRRMSRYCSCGDQGGQVREFKEMVKALHAAGIEVILDVVYNHTCEGNHLGPVLSWKGVCNTTYYRHCRTIRSSTWITPARATP